MKEFIEWFENTKFFDWLEDTWYFLFDDAESTSATIFCVLIIAGVVLALIDFTVPVDCSYREPVKVIDMSYVGSTLQTHSGVGVSGNGQPVVVVGSSGHSEEYNLIIQYNDQRIEKRRVDVDLFYKTQIGDTRTACIRYSKIFKRKIIAIE